LYVVNNFILFLPFIAAVVCAHAWEKKARLVFLNNVRQLILQRRNDVLYARNFNRSSVWHTLTLAVLKLYQEKLCLQNPCTEALTSDPLNTSPAVALPLSSTRPATLVPTLSLSDSQASSVGVTVDDGSAHRFLRRDGPSLALNLPTQHSMAAFATVPTPMSVTSGRVRDDGSDLFPPLPFSTRLPNPTTSFTQYDLAFPLPSSPTSSRLSQRAVTPTPSNYASARPSPTAANGARFNFGQTSTYAFPSVRESSSLSPTNSARSVSSVSSTQPTLSMTQTSSSGPSRTADKTDEKGISILTPMKSTLPRIELPLSRMATASAFARPSFSRVASVLDAKLDLSTLTAELSTKEMTAFLNLVYSLFDECAEKRGITKLYTQNDHYVACTNLADDMGPYYDENTHLATDSYLRDPEYRAKLSENTEKLMLFALDIAFYLSFVPHPLAMKRYQQTYLSSVLLLCPVLAGGELDAARIHAMAAHLTPSQLQECHTAAVAAAAAVPPLSLRIGVDTNLVTVSYPILDGSVPLVTSPALAVAARIQECGSETSIITCTDTTASLLPSHFTVERVASVEKRPFLNISLLKLEEEHTGSQVHAHPRKTIDSTDTPVDRPSDAPCSGFDYHRYMSRRAYVVRQLVDIRAIHTKAPANGLRRETSRESSDSLTVSSTGNIDTLIITVPEDVDSMSSDVYQLKGHSDLHPKIWFSSDIGAVWPKPGTSIHEFSR